MRVDNMKVKTMAVSISGCLFVVSLIWVIPIWLSHTNIRAPKPRKNIEAMQAREFLSVDNFKKYAEKILSVLK